MDFACISRVYNMLLVVSSFCALTRDVVLIDMTVDRGLMMDDFSSGTSGSLQMFRRRPGTTRNDRDADEIGLDQLDLIRLSIHCSTDLSYTIYHRHKKGFVTFANPN
jgi:hypothetical protein